MKTGSKGTQPDVPLDRSPEVFPGVSGGPGAEGADAVGSPTQPDAPTDGRTVHKPLISGQLLNVLLFKYGPTPQGHRVSP